MGAHDPIHPVILCGGSGTRLWPVSRKAKPKPFLPLIGEMSLFEEAVQRVSDPEHFAAPTVVAGYAHGGLITEQIEPMMDDGRGYRLIVEPEARNTAPAIALAAATLPDNAIMLVCPSDHHIADTAAFSDAALKAAALAREGWLVSFGITPVGPETGYGYLRRGEALEGGFRIAEFVEKPGFEAAKAYLASGEYSWNGGIFAFRAGTLLAELAEHRPEMAEAVKASVASGREEGALFHPEAGVFAAIQGESIDYAIMENTASAAMVPAQMGWSDIGNWDALATALEASRGDGNIARGEADFLDAKDVLAMSDGPRISVVGLSGVCVIVADGEVLVTSRKGAQKVGMLPGPSEQ